MFKLEIHSDQVDKREGTSARTGRDYVIRTQQAYVHLTGKPYPEEMQITLERDQAPYPPGEYTLTPSFFIGRFGDLQLGMRNARIELARNDKAKAVNG